MVLPLIFGALAPSLFTGMSPLLAASLGAGVGGAVQTGDLETGLLTGLGAFAGGALLGPMLGGGAGAANAAATGATGATAGTTAAQTAAQGVQAANAATAAANAAAPVTAQPGGLMSLMSGPAPGSTASLLGTPGSNPGMLKSAMNFAKSPTGMGVGIGSMAGPALAPLLKGGDEDDKKYSGPGSREANPVPRPVVAPPPGYRPGTDPEWDYGIGIVPGVDDILAQPMRFSDGGLLRRYQQMMGPIRMAAGGIATLAETDGAEASATPVGGNEKTVVVEAVRAIKGQSENPEVALAVFLKTYGEQALRDLVDRVQSGELDGNTTGQALSGPGDGMQDMIPANIDGEQDVLLSDGEFVIPSDVVSGLGNGSTDAGARALEGMMDRVRSARTGNPDQPPRVPQEAMLPA